MDQRSETTSHLKRYLNTVKHGELRSDRGSWFVIGFFLQLSPFNIDDTFKIGMDHPTSSSSSSTSPTTTVTSDSETRAREDLSGIHSHSASVSSESVDRQVRGDPYSSE